MRKGSFETVETSGRSKFIAAVMLASYILATSPASIFASGIASHHRYRKAAVEVVEKAEALITARDGGRIVLGDASIDIPEGALKEDTVISISRLARVEDTGETLYNAIPSSGGYRFLPAGTKFEKDVTITLPYSAELNSKQQSLEDLYTYFYDTERKCWTKLERLEVDEENLKVRSLSNHFTDMINATLTLPESAGPVDVNLNSIKNLEAAKPDGHLIKFNAPNAGPMGDASFSLELGIPSGRRGMQPQISVSYSSGGGNGIMGRGFDVNYGSAVTIDTRNGLQRYEKQYDASFPKDTSNLDTYILDGTVLEIQSYENKGNNIYDITYRPQKESSFSRIKRYGAGSVDDWWEVTDKSGTKRIYAQDSSSCVGGGQRTFTWNLTKVEDVHGNNIIYAYEKKDGYVYPSEILYTGYNGNKGNYCVKFHYDDDGEPTREDVRIDARSGETVRCSRLLTGITTHYYGKATPKGTEIRYDSNKAIRSYKFTYTEGLAREKMLTSLTVKNNADESYSYTFGYEEFAKDDDGNTVYYAKPVLWQNGMFLGESGGKSSGGNVSASAGVGFGFDYIDARVTGGVTGSTSTSTGYTRQTLIDIDGDGKCESVAQYGNTLRVYRQNETGTGFESDYETVSLNIRSFLMNEEKSTSNSFGWNVYGGTGTKNGAASAGYVYSSVTQDGSNSLYSGFYDMDGDGLVDIVTGTKGYLHNDTNAGGKIRFSQKNIYNYPDTYVRDLGEKLSEYRKSYAQQRPFSAWVPLYDGIVTANTSRLGNGSSYVKKVIGNEKAIKSEGLEIEQGKAIYCIPDLGDSPTKDVLEKEMNWENTVQYTEAKVFGRNLEMPVFFPKDTLSKNNCPKELEKLYAQVNLSENIIRYELKDDYMDYLDAESANKLMKEGRFVPGVMSEEFFKDLKEQISTKSPETQKENYYQKFADAYTYSVADRLFHLSSDAEIDEGFFNKYIKGFITLENLSEITDCYKVNGMDADLSGDCPSYRMTSTVTYPEPEETSVEKNLSGICYVRDGRTLLNIGKIDGKDVIIDVDSKKVVSQNGSEWKIMLKEFDDNKCVLDIGGGSYTVTFDFKDKKTYPQTGNNEDDGEENEENHIFYSYGSADITVEYSSNALYEVKGGDVILLAPGDSGLEKKSHKLWFPDGKSTFNSKEDFETENLIESKKELLLLYQFEVEDDGRKYESQVSIPSREFLYGGKYGWFCGIWTGSESEHSFTEQELNRIFLETPDKDAYKNSGSLTKEKIKEKGEAQEDEVKEKVADGNIKSTYKFGCTLPQKNGEMLEGTVSEYLREDIFDDNGVLGSKSETVRSSPYVGRGKIRCNRLGGNAYFNIEGIPENNASADGVLQKTISTGEDVTSGLQVSVLSVSAPTTTTENEGSAWTVQSLQDVNCDRIPDVLKIVGEQCHVYLGKADSIGNISYPEKPSFMTSDIKSLTMNRNSSESRGFSISPAGAIQTLYSISGRQKAVSLTNGIGGSTFKGDNQTTATIMDINADGIPDYVYYDEKGKVPVVYLGKGTAYEKAFDYGWDSISKGRVSGESITGSLGGSITIPIPGNGSSLSEDLSTKVTPSVDIGVSGSVSSSVQGFMLMDMNGDGLADAVRMAENQTDSDNIIYEVYYNTGSRISSKEPYKMTVPRWKTDDGNKDLTNNIGTLEVNNSTIKTNVVDLDEKTTVNLNEFNNDMENPDCSITASVNISGNLGVNVNIPIVVSFGQFNVTANVGGGINSGTTTTSATVKMIDLDGDGLPDHVLKADGKIWWKRNMMGKVGLLNRINLPQGGDIHIDYSEKYGTRDNPSFKYVMSRVTVNDGTDGTGPLPEIKHGEHSVTTLYEYAGGYYDRKRKEFYGFRTVRTIFADGTYQVNEYFNREYYSKGVPEETRAHAPKDDARMVLVALH